MHAKSTSPGRRWHRSVPLGATPEDLAALEERLTRPQYEAPDTETMRTELPAEMQAARRWLLWRAEGANGAGKPRKVPYYADGTPRRGRLDSPEDVARLVGFDEAAAALERGQWAGLGFALGPDESGEHWQGVDLDGTDQRPDLTGLTEVMPGYIERSPSGAGFHIIGRGRRFEALAPNQSGIEAYAGGRFFTVTGDALGGALADLAPFVETRLAPRHGTAERPAEDASAASGAEIPEGQRDATLASLAGTMRRRGFSEAAILAALIEENGARCKPPLERAQVEKIARSVARYAPDEAAAPEGADHRGALVAIPLEDLHSADIPETEYFIRPIIPVGEVTLFGGHGGAGKSIAALALCGHVACGKPIAGLAVKQGPACFVSFEDPPAVVRLRLRRIAEYYRLPFDALAANLRLIDATGAEPMALEAFAEGTRRLRFTETAAQVRALVEADALLCIDNASDAYAGNENERRQVRAFIRYLADMARPAAAAVLLLAHIDKVAAKYGSQGNTYSGSTQWHNSVRSRLALVEGEIDHEKLNLGKRLEARIPIEWTDSGVPVLIAPALTDAIDKDEDILTCIRLATERGESVPTAKSGPATAWHALADMPEFPEPLLKAKDGKDRLRRSIARLHASGRLRRESYRDQYRKERERWKAA